MTSATLIDSVWQQCPADWLWFISSYFGLENECMEQYEEGLRRGYDEHTAAQAPVWDWDLAYPFAPTSRMRECRTTSPADPDRRKK